MIQRVFDLKWTYIPAFVSLLAIIVLVGGITHGFGINAIISGVDAIDGAVVRLINGGNSAFLDSFMYRFSYKWTWVPFYVTLLAVIGRNFNWRQILIISLSIALVILLADQLCASYLRPAIGRFRPSHSSFADMLHYVNGYRGGNYGFPSCHAANSVALATFLCFIMRSGRLAALFSVWILMMAYTRMYLGVHYPSDLLTGSFIGIMIGSSIGLVAQRYGGVRPAVGVKWAWIPVAGFLLTCVGISITFLSNPVA